MSVVVQAVCAAPTIYTPKAGSKERKAILDVLRVPVARANGERPTFIKVNLKVSQRWAYVEADIEGAREKELDTPHIEALMSKTNNRWRILESGWYGHQVSKDWEKQYPEVPSRLWPHRR